METRDRYEYLPGRFLVKGDKFKASAGPYYLSSSGRKINMATKGRMVFDSLIIDDAGSQLIKTTCGHTLLVLPASQKTDIVHRPYKLTKVRQ